jgi:hypothetical protein
VSFKKDLRYAITVLMVVLFTLTLLFVRPMLVTGSAVDVDGTHIRTIFDGCILCVSKRVRVRANGYETESLQLSPMHTFSPGDRVAISRWFFGSWQHITVRLYAEQEVTYSRIESPLLWRGGEPVQVASLHPDQGQRLSPAELSHQIRRETKGRVMVAPYIALEVELTDTGAPMTETRPFRVLQETPYRRTVREREVPVASLSLHHKEGGFILVPPMDGLPDYNRYREIFRRLRTAPEEGYDPSVRLDFDLAHISEDVFYFYCRIGDRYGKGKVNAPNFDAPREKGTVMAHVEIWFNDDGGRALPQGY